jgi:alcohol dehydrogenase class IV
VNFEFATANRIVFGSGALLEAGTLARSLGTRALVVTGKDSDRAQPLRRLLKEAGVASGSFPATGEPTLALVEEGAAFASREQCDLVIGFGGGSALDTAKAIAALLANGGNLLDYLEVIGRGLPLQRPSLPCVAIPTTAGTGAEVTRNAVLSSPAHKAKVSLRSPFLMPRVALVDPQLTISLPPQPTAFSALDALTQLIEPFTCNRANPMVDSLCREGFVRVARSLRIAFHDGADIAAREDLCLASLFGGLALTNAGLGAVHGLAGPIGGMFNAPHGAICAALLPHVVRANQHALRASDPNSEILARYDQVAQLLTGCASAHGLDAAAWVDSLNAQLGIQPLAAYGIEPGDFPVIIAKSAHASSMKANPVQLSEEELNGILESACQMTFSRPRAVPLAPAAAPAPQVARARRVA